VTANVLQLGEVAEIEAQMFSFAQKFNRRTSVEPCTNTQSKPFSPAFGNTLLNKTFGSHQAI